MNMEDNTITLYGNIKYQQFNWEWNLLYEELEAVWGSVTVHYSPVTIETKVKWENMSLVNIQIVNKVFFFCCL